MLSRSRLVRVAPWLAVLVSSLFSASLQAQDDARATAVGSYFEVRCEDGDERLAELVREVVDPVWPMVCSQFGVSGARPKKPLLVVLYRNLDGYLAADMRLTGGRFQPNQAMAHWETKSAHVAMQPACDDAFLAKYGLPMQTQAMLAWEACHIVRFELCHNYRSHPGWFQDGLACTTARKVMSSLHPELDEQPFFSQRWFRVERLVADGDLPAINELLADQTQDLTMRDRYAARIAFFEYVQESYPEKIRRMADAIRSTAQGPSYALKVQAIARQTLGGLGPAFQSRVRAVTPTWNESMRSMWCFGEDWHQMAFLETSAQAYCSKPVRGGSFHATGSVIIHDGGARQMNFLFARKKNAVYSLAFVAKGGFTLYEKRGYGEGGRVISSQAGPKLEAGVAIDFDIRCFERTLTVAIGDSSWEIQLPRELPEEIIWGVGAQASSDEMGAFGVWRNVRVDGG